MCSDGVVERACARPPADCNAHVASDRGATPHPPRTHTGPAQGQYEHTGACLHSGVCMGRCVRVLGMTPTCSLSTDRQAKAYNYIYYMPRSEVQEIFQGELGVGVCCLRA